MIQSFKDKEAEIIFNGHFSRKLPRDIQRNALRKLLILDAAVDLKDLKIPPANHLETLAGSRQGQYSIRINNQWRICFTWHDAQAYRVEIIDYH